MVWTGTILRLFGLQLTKLPSALATQNNKGVTGNGYSSGKAINM